MLNHPLALLLIAALLTACGAPTLITGKVTDEDGNAVQGAVIDTQPETDPTLTNSEGVFVISVITSKGGGVSPLEAGRYVVTAKKGDLESEPLTVNADGKTEVELVAKKRVAEVGDAPPEPTPERPIDPQQTRDISSGQ